MMRDAVGGSRRYWFRLVVAAKARATALESNFEKLQHARQKKPAAACAATGGETQTSVGDQGLK
jgi:hypothetical protein